MAFDWYLAQILDGVMAGEKVRPCLVLRIDGSEDGVTGARRKNCSQL